MGSGHDMGWIQMKGIVALKCVSCLSVACSMLQSFLSSRDLLQNFKVLQMLTPSCKNCKKIIQLNRVSLVI